MLGDKSIIFKEFDENFCKNIISMDVLRFSKDERLKENLSEEIPKFINL